MSRTIILTSAVFLALAVIIGAFGAHGLKSKLPEDLMLVYQTGVEYHFYHALGMLLLGVLSISRSSKWVNWSALLLGLGIVLFSGSLYVLAITGIKGFGAVTPIGGVSFIAGWFLLIVSVWKR